MTKNVFFKQDIAALSQQIETKEISPIEIVRELLDRIEEWNPKLNAFITVTGEEALASAKQSEDEIVKGNYRGPLHGIPVGLKDLIYTKGIRTTMGSGITKDFVPTFDATVVKRLKDAGAVMIGKLNTHEFAYGPTGDVSYFGAVRNPFDTTKITGGSSSGSGAAVSAGLCYGALGTDTGGSIRIPSSACGIVGMKPTFGRVSKHGVYPLANTLDHVGPLTRTVRDNAILLNGLAGHDPQDDYSVKRDTEDFTRLLGKSIAGKVIGIPSNFYYDLLNPEVRCLAEQSIEVFSMLGAKIVRLKIRDVEQLSWAQLKTIQSEACTVHRVNLKEYPDRYQPEVLDRLKAGLAVPAYEYVEAQQLRKRILHSFEEAFREAEMLLTPTLPILPTAIGQREVGIEGQTESVRAALLRLTGPTNVTGLPSLSLPCGYSSEQMPVGLQLIGPAFSEALVYQFGDAFENGVHYKGFVNNN